MKPQGSAYVTRTDNRERLWHRRFGHLNEQSMRKLVREELVNHLDYSTKLESVKPALEENSARAPSTRARE